MKIRALATVDQVIEAITPVRLRLITGRGQQNVTNWRRDGFPTDTYVAIQAELKRLHFSAPDRLWPKMIPAVRSRAA